MREAGASGRKLVREASDGVGWLGGVGFFFFFTPRPNVLRKDEISWTKGEKPGKTHAHTTHQRTGKVRKAGQLGVLIIELITTRMTKG